MKNANENNAKSKQNANKKKVQNKQNVKNKQIANENNNKNKQKNKNNIKKKKDNTKSLIDSPFSFDLPSIDSENYSQLVSCLKQSFRNYLDTLKRTKQSKENTKSTSVEENTKSAVVRDARKRNTKKLLSNADPACIVFGYNSVMRDLEKEKIKTVFVNADAKPDMLIKSFIPVCNLQSIPLIPVKDLSNIFVKELGIKSTIAVGFTLAACEKEGPFNSLHISCCRALGYDDCRQDLLGNKEISKPRKNKQDQFKNSKKAKTNLISYHLKRENKRNRVFEPPKRENPIVEFIKSKPLKLSTKIDSKLDDKPKADTIFKKDSTCDTKQTLPEVPEMSFYIDLNNDDIDWEEKKEEHSAVDDSSKKPVQKKKRSTARYFDDLIKPTTKSDYKRKAHYIPAKIKKMKPNSERHLP